MWGLLSNSLKRAPTVSIVRGGKPKWVRTSFDFCLTKEYICTTISLTWKAFKREDRCRCSAIFAAYFSLRVSHNFCSKWSPSWSFSSFCKRDKVKGLNDSLVIFLQCRRINRTESRSSKIYPKLNRTMLSAGFSIQIFFIIDFCWPVSWKDWDLVAPLCKHNTFHLFHHSLLQGGPLIRFRSLGNSLFKPPFVTP